MFSNAELNNAEAYLENAKDRYNRALPYIENACLKRLGLLGQISSNTLPEVKKLARDFNTLVEAKEECVEKYKLCKLSTQLRNLQNTLESSVNNFTAVLESCERAYNGGRASSNVTGMIIGGLGIAAGGAVTLGGPTALMAIAITFGTASTGVAIGSLSGAAATKAALAWLGGGAISAGGGGVAAGEALIAATGPVGLIIAGVSLLLTGIWYRSKNQENARILVTAAKELDSVTNDLIHKYELIVNDFGFAQKINSNAMNSLRELSYYDKEDLLGEKAIGIIERTITQVESVAGYMNNRLSFSV